MIGEATDQPGNPSAAAARPLPSSSLLVPLLLTLGTMVLYNAALKCDFLMHDDPNYVFLNKHVLQGLTWSNIGWAFTTTFFSNWHPLTWISHMAAVQFFHLNPMGHHLLNVFLHTLNVVLLYRMLREATGSMARSAVVAALFAVHPFNVESVAWISERKGLLCTLFAILAFQAYTRYARNPGARRYIQVMVFFALALMSKPMAITLPFLFLLFDFWPLERIPLPGGGPAASPGETRFMPAFGKLLLEKWPLFLMSLGSAIVTTYAQASGGAVASLVSVPMRFRLGNALQAWAGYALKGVWPSHLAVFYPHPQYQLIWWKAFAALIFLLVVTIAVWYGRGRRYLVTGWLWFLVSLVPVIGIMQLGLQSMADRYAYIPLIGLFISAVWLASDMAARFHFKRALMGITVVILGGYAWVTHVEIGYWHDTVTLFSRALEVTPDNVVARRALATAFEQAGRPDLALPQAVQAVHLAPNISPLHRELADVLQDLGQIDNAMREYQIALRQSHYPQYDGPTHSNLANALSKANHLPKALAEFNIAIDLDNTEANSYLGRGLAEYRMGRLDAAYPDFVRAGQLGPSAQSFYWIGRVLEDRNELNSAAGAYRSALALTPGMNEARARLAAVEERLRK